MPKIYMIVERVANSEDGGLLLLPLTPPLPSAISSLPPLCWPPSDVSTMDSPPTSVDVATAGRWQQMQ
jgi:hypothetical protein